MQCIQTTLQTDLCPLFQKLYEQLHGSHTLVKSIHHTLEEYPRILTHQGVLIRPHVNDQLDVLNKIIYDGKDYLIQLQQKESQRTNIPSLKISYNGVFGYYLEVPNAHKNKVPTDWMRKQTLSGAERYITEALSSIKRRSYMQKKRHNCSHNNSTKG